MEFEATVTGLSAQGSGIVKAPAGKTYFVSGAWPGDRGRFALKRAQGNFGEAVIREPLAGSEERGQVPCSHHGTGHGRCGGCPWLGISYDRQLEAKHQMTVRLLARYGIRTPVSPVASSLHTWGYRNRVQLKTDGTNIGFVSPTDGKLVPVETCGVLEPSLGRQVEQAVASLPRQDWLPGEGHAWNYLELEEGLDWETRPLNRRLPFRQGNSAQNQTLLAWVAQQLGECPGPVLELFCGSGNLTALSGGRSWTAVEANLEGVQALEAALLPGVRVVRSDCYQRGGWFRFLAEDQRVLVLDPPRQGFGLLSKLVHRLKGLDHIIYLSCQPSSWVRDIGPLIRREWELTRVQPLDLFPQTPHVELLTVLSRRERDETLETRYGSSP